MEAETGQFKLNKKACTFYIALKAKFENLFISYSSQDNWTHIL